MLKKTSWVHNRCKNRLQTVGFDHNGICLSLNNNAFQSIIIIIIAVIIIIIIIIIIIAVIIGIIIIIIIIAVVVAIIVVCFQSRAALTCTFV